MTEERLQAMSKDIKELSNSLKDLEIRLTKQISEIPERILERADRKYAAKTAERIAYGAVSIILISFFSALVYLVIK